MNFSRPAAAACLSAVALALGIAPAAAQESYPEREVRWIIPWNAGGSNDIMARFLQPLLEEDGLSVVIENAPGGTGAVGLGQVATADADGYTIGNGTSSTLAIIAQDKAPLENDQFTHVIRLSVDPLMLLVPGNSEHDTLEEFLAYMKEKPGEVTIGTPGTNNINHIFAAMTGRAADVPFRRVPYPGGSRVIAALMGNQLDAGVLKPSETMEQIKAGDLKAIGVFDTERVEALPDVPTFAEMGHDVFPYGPMVQMGYIEAPAGLDPAVEEILVEKFHAAITSEEFREFAEQQGFVIDPISGDELDQEVEEVGAAIAKVAEEVFDDEQAQN